MKDLPAGYLTTKVEHDKKHIEHDTEVLGTDRDNAVEYTVLAYCHTCKEHFNLESKIILEDDLPF